MFKPKTAVLKGHGSYRWLITALATLLTAAAALGCGWSLWTDHSVRFNGFRGGRGFYRLPPLPFMHDRKTNKDLDVDQISENAYNGEQEHGSATEPGIDVTDPNEIWTRASVAINEGDLKAAHSALTSYMTQTKLRTIDDNDNSERQQRRRSATDMLDVLGEIKHGSSTKDVQAYLTARTALDEHAGTNVDEMIRDHSKDKNLEDNWSYLKAALLLKRSAEDTTAAVDAFRKHAKNYPTSEKNESVLYMIAKLTMQSSHSFENAACGVYDDKFRKLPIHTPNIEPVESCRDAKWNEAVEEFRRLIEKYPHGSYHNDARGWLAYLYRRGGMRAEALAEYYRLLGNRDDREWRLEAKRSLQVLDEHYDDETMDKVESLIAAETDSAMAYAYHGIYNQAIDLTYEEYPDYRYYSGDGSDDDEKKAVSDDHATGRRELSRIAKFSTTMIERNPRASVSGGFVLRVAEAQLELTNFADALRLAKKAICLGVSGDLRAQALWVKGSCEHETKDIEAAQKSFEQLITEFPKSELTEGAERLLAMNAEDQGDLETALDHYLRLRYDDDVAYFVDVLMPTDTLSKYVSGHPRIPQHNKLLYALGVRYMRERRWDEARATYRQISAEPPKTADTSSDNSMENEVTFAKEPIWDDDRDTIKTSWIAQDLKTIDRMIELQKAVDIAEGDENKAEAMYQLASFQFGSSSLLFYDPAVWQDGRYMLISDLASGDHMRLPNESQILFEYSQSHDTLARCIPIYLEIVDRYPKTKAARDAMYSAAVAHEKLSQMNPYWREIYADGLFAGPRMVSYDDVKRTYPNYQLPRGTYGWEPSTRTVNGGPGWAPAPKPLPRISKAEKIKRKGQELFDEYSPAVKTKVSDAATTSYWWFLRYLYIMFGTLFLLVAWKCWKSRM